MSELRVSSVSRAFGGVQAVEDVSFVLEAGTVTALIGPNGAGKSTLFNLIDGQLEPDAGVIEFEGQPLSRMPTAARTRAGIGRTFQVAQTFASMTVLQNAQMALVAAAGAALVDRSPARRARARRRRAPTATGGTRRPQRVRGGRTGLR